MHIHNMEYRVNGNISLNKYGQAKIKSATLFCNRGAAEHSTLPKMEVIFDKFPLRRKKVGSSKFIFFM